MAGPVVVRCGVLHGPGFWQNFPGNSPVPVLAEEMVPPAPQADLHRVDGEFLTGQIGPRKLKCLREEQVLVMLPTGGDWGEDMRVIALDLATGETRWELDPEGYPFVIGGRLVTDDNDGFVVYR